MKRTRALWMLVLFTVVLVAGCSAGRPQGQSAKGDSGGVSSPAAPSPGGVAQDSAEPPRGPNPTTPMPEPSPMPPIDPPGNGTSAGPINPDMERKIIRNATIDVKIKDADAALVKLGEAVRAAGGYVQETRQEGSRQNGRYTHISLRVPAGSYGSILDLVADLGEVNNRREWTNDVTEEYLDLEARIKTKQTHLEQLQRLYEMTGSIRELMELEQEIARVTAELESFKGRVQFLSNHVAYSTITISLYEPGVPTPIRDPQSVWERVDIEFNRSWNNVVNFTGDAIVFGAAAIPVVVYGLILGGAGYGLFRVARRRFRRPPPGV